jgi:hypothetical protein
MRTQVAMRHPLAAVVLAVLLGSDNAIIGAQASQRAGCYRANRPLGSSPLLTGIPDPIGERLGETGSGLKVLETFRLLDSGRVDRPGTVMRGSWAAGSRWRTKGDSVLIELTTLALGWHLSLLPVARGDSVFAGQAEFVSDVVVVGPGSNRYQPFRVTVLVAREQCPPNT